MTRKPLPAEILYSFLDKQPHPIIYYTPIYDGGASTIIDFEITYCNEEAAFEYDYTQAEITGERVSSLAHADDATKTALHQQLLQAYESTENLEFTYYNAHLKKYFCTKRFRVEGGVLSVSKNVTTEVRERAEREQQETLSNLILNSSLNAWFTANAVLNKDGQLEDFVITRINPAFTRIVGLDEEAVVGKHYLKLFPSSREHGVYDINQRVYETGRGEQLQLLYRGEGLDAWYEVSVTKLGEIGILVNFSDITVSRKALEEIQHKNKLLDNILQHSASGISVTRVIRNKQGDVVDGMAILANDAAIAYTGISREVYFNKTAVELEPNILQSDYFQMCLNTLNTGTPSYTQYKLEATGRWLQLTISRMDSEHLITIFSDITESKNAQLAVESSAQQLQTIINRTQSGIFTIEPVFNEKNKVEDFRFLIVNRTLANYVGQEPETLVGQLGSLWFTDYKTNGLFDLFTDTYLNGNTNRFDFHYNADGIDAWIDMMCTRFENNVLVTFTDYTGVKKLQLELASLVEALKRSNQNLEEFAYAASHDLQEPLRKIHTFADKLRQELAPQINERHQALFERIESATRRMRHLIDDLLSYSEAGIRQFEKEPVHLSEILDQTLQDLENSIHETGAVINKDSLPTIEGNERQWRQLFQNLIGNAIKYRRQDVPPEINIRCRTIKATDPIFETFTPTHKGDFYLIDIEDNGIGFEQENAEKIFKVFQRLHGKSEYEGTGVGLSIVQRVVNNHEGYVLAEGKPGAGATFRIILPK
jgi:PAS domain S-box-containing protein